MQYRIHITARNGDEATAEGAESAIEEIKSALIERGAEFRTQEECFDFGFYGPINRAEPLFRKLASAVYSYHSCRADLERIEQGKMDSSWRELREQWRDRWEQAATDWTDEFMPSGSGFDSGTKLDLEASTGEKLVFYTSFHHMDSGGMYDGWTDHTITVRPSLVFGYDMKISGRDRNDIKDLIADYFRTALDTYVKSPDWTNA